MTKPPSLRRSQPAFALTAGTELRRGHRSFTRCAWKRRQPGSGSKGLLSIPPAFASGYGGGIPLAATIHYNRLRAWGLRLWA